MTLMAHQNIGHQREPCSQKQFQITLNNL